MILAIAAITPIADKIIFLRSLLFCFLYPPALQNWTPLFVRVHIYDSWYSFLAIRLVMYPSASSNITISLIFSSERSDIQSVSNGWFLLTLWKYITDKGPSSCVLSIILKTKPAFQRAHPLTLRAFDQLVYFREYYRLRPVIFTLIVFYKYGEYIWKRQGKKLFL